MSRSGKTRPGRLGILLALFYVFVVVVVFALIALGPADDGMEWIPFMLLDAPWCWMGSGTGNIFSFVPGIMANAFLLFLLGTLIEIYLRSRAEKMSGQ